MHIFGGSLPDAQLSSAFLTWSAMSLFFDSFFCSSFFCGYGFVSSQAQPRR